MNRRSFLKTLGAAGLTVVAAPLFIPSERLAFGIPTGRLWLPSQEIILPSRMQVDFATSSGAEIMRAAIIESVRRKMVLARLDQAIDEARARGGRPTDLYMTKEDRRDLTRRIHEIANPSKLFSDVTKQQAQQQVQQRPALGFDRDPGMERAWRPYSIDSEERSPFYEDPHGTYGEQIKAYDGIEIRIQESGLPRLWSERA